MTTFKAHFCGKTLHNEDQKKIKSDFHFKNVTYLQLPKDKTTNRNIFKWNLFALTSPIPAKGNRIIKEMQRTQKRV